MENHHQSIANRFSQTSNCQNCSNSLNVQIACQICKDQQQTPKSAKNIPYFFSNDIIVQNKYKIDEQAIFQQIIRKQDTNRYYNQSAFHLEVRLELISWLKQANDKLLYRESTFHLACAILDAVLSLYAIEERHIKLVSFMTVHLAAKLQEHDSKVVEISHIEEFFKGEFDIEEISKCEVMIFKILDYSVNIITPYSVAEFLVSDEVVSNKDNGYLNTDGNADIINEKFEKLIFLYIDASLLVYDFYHYSSVEIAVSAILLAINQLNMDEARIKHLETITKVKTDLLQDCMHNLHKACKNYYNKELTEIVMKKSKEVREPFAKLNSNLERQSTAVCIKNSKVREDGEKENLKVSEFRIFDGENEYRDIDGIFE